MQHRGMAAWVRWGMFLACVSSASCFSAGPPLAPAVNGRRCGLLARKSEACPAGAFSPALLVPVSPSSGLVRKERAQLVAPRLGMETIFQIDNYLTLPFWAMMILAPKSRITRSIMSGWLPFLPLIFVYIFTLVASVSSPGALDVFKSAITLKTLSVAAQEPAAMAAIWAHLVTFDLFVGRWILFDSLRNKVFAGHSLLLALFAGPVGLVTHLVTRAIHGGAGGGNPRDGISDGLVDSMSDESLMDLARD